MLAATTVALQDRGDHQLCRRERVHKQSQQVNATVGQEPGSAGMSGCGCSPVRLPLLVLTASNAQGSPPPLHSAASHLLFGAQSPSTA
jgi:hypothetical protein